MPATGPTNLNFVSAALIVVACLGIFAADSLTPLGFAHGFLYLPLVVVAALRQQRPLLWLSTGVSVIATWAGLAISAEAPEGTPMALVLSNRLGASLALILLATAIDYYWRVIALMRLHHAEAIERSQQFESLTESLPVQIWTATPDGVVDYIGKKACELTGKTREEALADWLGLLHPDDREITTKVWLESIASGTDYRVEFRLRHHLGHYIWHLTQATPERDDTGKILRWMGSSIDISYSKQLELEARKLAERLNTTVESITDAFLVLDHNFIITYANRKAQEILGPNEQSLIDQPITDYCEEEEPSAFIKAFAQAVETQSPVSVEAYYEPRDVWLAVRAYPSRDGLTVYFVDVTEERQLAQALSESRHMEAIGRLTGGIAHDFNNLLTVILGNADTLFIRSQNNPDVERAGELITQAAERAASLTQSLLAFSRRQPLAPEAIAVNEALDGLKPILESSLGSLVDLRFDVEADLWQAHCDLSQLENALLNLALNARDAMPEGGRLSLRARNITLDQTFTSSHSDVAPGDYVVISVEDSGEGIAPEDIERIFDPFFTTKPPDKGTGLGLSTVFGFVKQSGGYIAVYSEPGEGSRFDVYLPRSRGQADTAPEPSPPGTPAQTVAASAEGRHLLVVEDNDQLREVAVAMLESAGYQVTTAGSGDEALTLLDRRFDGVFSDIIMPGDTNGVALARHLRQHHPNIPVLLASGFAEDTLSDRHQLADLPLLHKPYRREQLLNALAALWR
ncbi:hybrid sensor histidine kinase/response regulator [Marinimicrobium alkaliphilum]|uniref:hybrid sensor histidine kinase/response regulator n=1 Tax=Marinimicrobium alkaliphilum TaxID=2202654 RepID=UPI000DBA786C|nr:PAS domain-containing sensor histidine kinase [Marinimicrobium alkaliphilum]